MEKLTSLRINTFGWNIDYSILPTPERKKARYSYSIDKFYFSEEFDIACLMYTITEYRMGAYAGLVALYKNKDSPKLVYNSFKNWYIYRGDRSALFVNNKIILRLLNKTEGPFIVFDLHKDKFATVPFDYTSIYYDIEHLNGEYKIRLKDIESRKRIQKCRDGETIKLSELGWNSLEIINEL